MRNAAAHGLVNSHMAEVAEVGRCSRCPGVIRTAASGLCLGRHRAWVPGPNRGQRDHRGGGQSLSTEDAEAFLRGDQADPAQGGAGTDDSNALGEHLETAMGERVATLEALEPKTERATLCR